jgi:hypothetical protein
MKLRNNLRKQQANNRILGPNVSCFHLARTTISRAVKTIILVFVRKES